MMRDSSTLAGRAFRALDQLGPLLAMTGVWALFAALKWNSFATWENAQSILLQTAVVGVAALGGTMVIISGGIDLSMGSLIALVSVVVAMTLKKLAGGGADASGLDPNIAVTIASVVGVAVAGLCGLAIGVMVIGRHWLVFAAVAAGLEAYLVWHYGGAMFAAWPGRVTVALLAAVAVLAVLADVRLRPRTVLMPFIVTLGMWGALRGAAKGLADNSAIYPPATGITTFMQLPRTNVDASLVWKPWQWWSPGVWIFLALAVVVAGVLRYTQFGRHVYAIGSNEQTARLCGVHVERSKLKVYTLAALLTGVAGVLQFSFNTIGDPTTAAGYELKVIAAVVIGGASLSGGVGSVLGTVAGAMMMTIIDNGCTKVGLEVWMQEIITGGIIVAAVALDQLRRRKA
jgi:ribose transport system permease protein